MKKVFYPLVLAVTVLIGGVLAYSIWTAKPLSSQTYYESGKKYYDEKKYSEAIIQFLNAVRKDPRNRDARYYLASSFSLQQDFQHAVAELNALLEYYPDDVDANLQLGGIYLTAGRDTPDYFRRAQEIAAKILKKEPNNVNALLLSGNSSVGLQDYRSSVDFFEKALALDPQNVNAFVSLGTTQVAQKNYPEAEQAFLKAREVDSKNQSVLISLGNYYRAVRDLNRAEAVFKEALSIYPSDRTIYLQVVEFYIQTGRVQDAEQVLMNAQAQLATDPEPSLILVDLYTANDRPADARKLLLELKEKFPKNVDVASKVALSFLQDQPQRARAEIDEIIKLEPQNPVGHILLGEFQFISGQYDLSEATLSKAPAVDSPFPQVHFFLGNIALRKTQIDQAIFHYQKSLAVNSRYLPARVALAEMFLRTGKTAESREEVRKALEIRPDFAPARLLKATLDGADKNFSSAEKELSSLAKQYPKDAIVYRQMAVYNDSRGQTAEAEKNFIRALELQPDSPDILRDLTLFYLRTNQTDRALQRLNAIPAEKKQAVHWELLGLVQSKAGQMQEAENSYKKALEKEPRRVTADTYLFANYVSRGDLDQGIKTLDDMIKKNPSDAGAYATKGALHEAEGRIAEAKQSYEQALKLNPNADMAANNLAYILADEGSDLQRALSYAQAARQRQPENPSVADTLGWVYYKLGNHVLAREQLKFAVSKQPDNPTFQYHLGLVYKANNQTSEAVEALKRAANSSQNFKEKPLAQAALKEIR